LAVGEAEMALKGSCSDTLENVIVIAGAALLAGSRQAILYRRNLCVAVIAICSGAKPATANEIQ
jgi:hypothetical protein